MLLYLKQRIRMNEHAFLNFGNWGLIGANLVLGFATMEAINVAIAISGAVVTIFANADKVAYSIVRIIELKRNGWKLPKPTPTPPATDKTEKNEVE